MFQDIIAPVDQNKFDIELALEKHKGVKPTPFSGLDKSLSPVCEFFVESTCPKGSFCPYRHVRGDKTVVCKHWLRGLCKKGDSCEFLHEFDMSKMPECYFFSKFNSCSNKDCPFLHINPQDKVKDCAWYTRGFCRHGEKCKNRHIKRKLCRLYLFGFCPNGPNCKSAHPRFEIPLLDDKVIQRRQSIICRNCGEPGHKAAACSKQPGMPPSKPPHMQGENRPPQHLSSVVRPVANFIAPPRSDRPEHRGPRSIEDMTCYKCGMKGHLANRCPQNMGTGGPRY
ncbi:cleavage and polyadenylation specificity factor subunit 4-like [Paramacrobiotus metropolitanus]|uniref:cleavage and polyadenylation specificity factor subunit 4-like n=1 Tax=Paramacrobiotus metropolitanus TaxID=2943436 RepID=UPI002445D279|nr:cleavage and polyadenylation specificity factor subunit 4-like [Paramacrobiotus metropolitanus]